jgi:plasmid stabilization system protein ParE
MGVTYKAEARLELVEAARYYEASRPGLGRAFLGEVEMALEDLLKQPLRWRKIGGRFRRCLVRRFPYGIIYTTEGHDVLIFAFMHLHRKPGYWKSRDWPSGTEEDT